MWDQLWFCLREAEDPKVVVTTTPKALAHVKTLVNRARTDASVVLTKGRTVDNRANLSEAALAELDARYAGTRIGRQEMDAELLEDVEGALWTMTQIEAQRYDHDVHLRARGYVYDPDVPQELPTPMELLLPEMRKVVIAVDPAVTNTEDSDETGIVGVGVVGTATDAHGFILADRSGKLSPQQWAQRAVDLYYELEADAIVAEVNNGGDLVHEAIRNVDPTVRYRAVHASRGKRVRAEPVSQLYEQGRVHHVGMFPELEDQMTTWTPDDKDSPDRMDALVWGVSDLMVRRVAGSRASAA
jgi:phage terminase large subunit-like protein